MEKIIESINKCLSQKNWYAALVFTIIIPDYCGSISNQNRGVNRYVKWFNEYMPEKYMGRLSGNVCYALRCAILHSFSSNIEKEQAKVSLDRFVFHSKAANLSYYGGNYIGDPETDGKNILLINVNEFCLDMLLAVDKWMTDQGNEIFEDKLNREIDILEGNFKFGALNIIVDDPNIE